MRKLPLLVALLSSALLFAFHTDRAWAQSGVSNAEQPGVVVQIYPESGDTVVTSIQREAGMDRAGFNHEGVWYTGAGKMNQGLFRGNQSVDMGQRRIYVKILGGPGLAVRRQWLVTCTPTKDNYAQVYEYGVCTLHDGISDSVVRIESSLIHDTGSTKKPAQLKLLVLKFHIIGKIS